MLNRPSTRPRMLEIALRVFELLQHELRVREQRLPVFGEADPSGARTSSGRRSLASSSRSARDGRLRQPERARRAAMLPASALATSACN